jgi:hypothetical protein
MDDVILCNFISPKLGFLQGVVYFALETSVFFLYSSDGTRLPYDCGAGMANWQLGWSDASLGALQRGGLRCSNLKKDLAVIWCRNMGYTHSYANMPMHS